jgi:thiol-disulfide isomerase/thioredoxin
MNTNYIKIIIAVLLIGGAIWYLESGKVKNTGGSEAVTIVAPDEKTSQATTTMTKGSMEAGKPTNTNDSKTGSAMMTLSRTEKSAKFKLAKEITTPDGFINTGGQPIKIQDYIGKKVVLIDFWTYSCINCQRTTPYLNGWYKKYEDKGLVIIGIHTPEFDFEKVYDNVKAAVDREGIKYPVVLDNDYSTWNAYENRFWPRKYLIDIDGYVVYDHIGEGSYAETEKEIQKALQERQKVLGLNQTIDTSIFNPADAVTVDSSKVQSPESYFGSSRNQYFGNGNKGVAGVQKLSLPSTIQANTLYLDGTWDIQGESAKSTSASAKIVYKYNAKDIYFVGSSEKGVKVTIMEDGKIVGKDKGADVSADGTVMIKENRLYKLIQASDYAEHTIEIIIENPGLEVFAFTFG